MSEFTRLYDAARLPAGPQHLEATAEECAALARRFALVSVKALSADLTLAEQGQTVAVTGMVKADLVQSCAISGEDLAVRIAEPVALRFVPANTKASLEEEIELTADELDEIEMDHGRFDLGEAVAQTLALGIDPYLTGPGAEQARRKAGLLEEGQAGPLAGLKDLFKK